MTGAMIPVSGVTFAFTDLPDIGGIDHTCILHQHHDVPEEKHPRCSISALFIPKPEGESG